jgi:3-hydroxymyristoyl/3-hydroxydecanoyl-(acyl carrier protein) dehydratase
MARERPVTPESLPHTVPFLFVDRVLSIDSDGARVLRGVTRNDALLRGRATLPPTLLVEALAQAAGLLIASSDPTLAAGSLAGIDGFVFRGAVRSGDRVVLEVKLHRVHLPLYVVAGRALVDGEVRAEGRITLSTELPWKRPPEARASLAAQRAR